MKLQDYESKYPPRDNLPSGAEVVRVAPSPTGRPHIGTALQSAIDRAIAGKSGGVFILRIEDTDRKRLIEEAVSDIVDSLQWLELAPDEGPHLGGEYGPYSQSERLDIYQAAADWLVEQGHAYYCFCTSERLEEVRKAQQAAGQTSMYDRHCRDLDPEEAERRRAAGETCVVRMRVPDDEQITFTDPLRGEITFDSNLIDDQVLLKSDGFPTYHLAVVVDDHFMRVTTAIRGEEWISSTPKHLLLYRYFGWQVPLIVHTPLLRDASRRKLSKRSGDTSIDWYRSQGYLPQGFRNFLTRIIWAHPEEKDVYPFEEFVRRFEIKDLSKAGPVVDHDLLDFINSHYMRELTAAELYDALLAFLERLIAQGEGASFEEAKKSGREMREISQEYLEGFATALREDREYALRVLSLEPERFKKLADVILQYGLFFPRLFEPPAIEQLTKQLGNAEVAAQALSAYLNEYYDPGDDHEQWESKIRQQAEQMAVKAGKLFMTLRLALTASDQTPPLFEIMQVLGAEEVKRRIEMSVKVLAGA